MSAAAARRIKITPVAFEAEWKYFASSEGSYIEQEVYNTQPGFSVTAHVGDITQSRQFTAVPKTAGGETAEESEMIENAERIAAEAEKMGYSVILTEGIERVLGWRSPNYAYRPQGCEKIKLLMRNYRLSDDVGYRFSSRQWPQWPLTAEKYASWLDAADGECVNLFMDYETFGEHHWKDTGILDFLRHLPAKLSGRGIKTLTVSEAAKEFEPRGTIDAHATISWADQERDESAWLGNEMQKASFCEVENLRDPVRKTGDPALMKIWRMLQTSDHFMYFCTKSWADGDVHEYFSPYKGCNPYENFVNYMNTVQDFKQKVGERLAEKRGKAMRAEARLKWPVEDGQDAVPRICRPHVAARPGGA